MIITSGFTKDILRTKGAKVILTNEAQTRLQTVEPLMVRPEYVVKDLFERKTYNKPGRLGIGPEAGPCKGMAWGIAFEDIKAVVIG